MWQMLQQDEPVSYVVATGVLHSVQDVVETAFAHAGLDWNDHVRTDERLLRPRDDRAQLVGDAARARELLGWEPTVGFEELIRLMVDADLARLDRQVAYTPAQDWPASQAPVLL
jgi:GDPmannose 4,6-dehydratase